MAAGELPPPPIYDSELTSLAWQEWFRQVRSFLVGGGSQISWNSVNKSGASITDIPDRKHNNLQSVQGGATNDYYHLTATQHTDLTDGGDTTLHKHDGIYPHVTGAVVTSSNTVTHKVPVTINGTTYYILLSNV